MSQIQDWNDQSIQDDKNKYVIGDVRSTVFIIGCILCQPWRCLGGRSAWHDDSLCRALVPIFETQPMKLGPVPIVSRSIYCTK